MATHVSMSATAIRAVMGDAFDYASFEQGRKDTHEALDKFPGGRDAYVKQVRDHLSSGIFKNTPGPSYWVGCLSELDFTL